MFNNNQIINMLVLISIAGNLLPHEEIQEQLSFFDEKAPTPEEVDFICNLYADELPF